MIQKCVPTPPPRISPPHSLHSPPKHRPPGHARRFPRPSQTVPFPFRTRDSAGTSLSIYAPLSATNETFLVPLPSSTVTATGRSAIGF